MSVVIDEEVWFDVSGVRYLARYYSSKDFEQGRSPKPFNSLPLERL